MIKRKLKKIIIILIVFIILFPYTVTLAISQEEAGKAIAKYSYNFCMKLGYNSGNNMCIYDWSSNRKKGYKLQLTSGVAEASEGRTKSFTNKYPMDCVGFVSTMIHQSLGIGGEEFTYFVTPGGGDSPYVEKVSGSAKPGDIGCSKKHVWVYLGNMQGRWTAESNSTPDFAGPQLSSKVNAATYGYYRIKESYANTVTTYKESPDGTDLAGSSFGAKQFEESKFYYNGIPDGKYSVTASFTEWIIDALKDILDYIIGIITLCQRMPFVGWTTIIENLITNTIYNIDHDGENDTKKDQHPTSTKVDESTVTIESIIFNDLDILNVDFFKELDSDSETEVEAEPAH